MKFKPGHPYVGRTPMPIADRFWPKVDKKCGPVHPIHGRCWTWTAMTNVRTGYAVLKVNGKNVHASRVSWELAHGTGPGDLFVCHKCDNPRCVRPEHLFLGTHKDNTADMIAKGRGSDALYAEKAAQTECLAGHQFNETNTTYKVNGTRRCRVCDRLRARERRAAATASGCSLDRKYRPNRKGVTP